MNKTAIKNFAIWARNKLIADIVYQAGLMGVTEKGITQPLPQSTNEVQFFDIGTKDYMTVRGKAIRQRNAFVAAIKAKQADTDYVSAFRFVVEKVAYTWFNRLIAIRFMEVNDYLPGRVRVLSSENPGKAEPDMVTRPFDTDLSLSAQEQDEIMRMKDENKLDELFRMLFIKQCQKLHEVLPVLFDPQGIERVDSYLELLLTISFTDKDGVLWHLVHDIDEDDFNVEKEGQVEIIGWMYQYYNTEPKQQVFDNLKKNIKISKDNIPAATQLFTPDWIVRYMVENSLGRLWVEGHPNEELKKNWKYYLEEAEQEPQVQAHLTEIRKKYASLRPEEIKVIDPCMGSGHILVYLFDVLMQIYESQGWTQREAAQSIVQNNLYGLDIDDRAAQLAYFAVMMKARQYDRRFLERGFVPHVYGIQESNGINREHLKLFGNGMTLLEKNNALNQLNEMLDALRDVKEYGSIVNVPELDWDLLRRYTLKMDSSVQITLDTVGADETIDTVQQLVAQGQAMAQKYHTVVTNPPYMGSAGMGPKLVQYVKEYYPNSKSDLFSVFIEHSFELLVEYGFSSLITMESWMFLTSFEKLRKDINEKKTIVSLVHMPYLGKGGTSLGINFGTEMAIISNSHISKYKGIYDRIAYYETDANGVPFSFPVENTYYKKTSQDRFTRIPGMPIAYWVSDKLIQAFETSSIKDYGFAGIGMRTGDNARFLRLWQEIDYNTAIFGCKNREQQIASRAKWVPYNKGGDFRKWYGNNSYLVNWFNDGEEIKANTRLMYPYLGEDLGWKISNEKYYYQPGITWSGVTTGSFSCRLYDDGFIFDSGANGLFAYDASYRYYLAGLLNSSLGSYVLQMINPTINFGAGVINKVPVLSTKVALEHVIKLVQQNVSISHSDWDSFESSWDFQYHPLMPIYTNHPGEDSYRLEDFYDRWMQRCAEQFQQLKDNEEELNRIFIDVYGLQDELSVDVDEKDVTVHKADKTRDIKSLISFAVGCMLGRYQVGSTGLKFAGGDWKEYAADQWPNPELLPFAPDQDNCIPITDESYFEDDIVGRFVEFIKIVYGSNTLEENLNYIAEALGNKGNSSRDTIRNYFLNDFFKDHCSVYSVTGSGKRPIYWLFDSGKQNGFKALVYMHRWNADTVGNLRVEYLHRMQRVYEKEIERMQDIIDNSRDNREVNQASKRREKLVKQLKEARDYDAKIAHVALSRVEIDLDDGVKVNYEKVQKGPDGKSLGILAKI